MVKIGAKYSPAENVLDFNGNKIDYIEVLEKDKEVSGNYEKDKEVSWNYKVLVYPEAGFCSVDSFPESDFNDKFKIKK